MPDAPSRLNAALTGRYRVERQLGEGGMATVYLASDLKHNRKVALKVLKPELAAVVGAERFLAEIRTTANLQHPHVLPLHDSGEADGLLFYVMPYIEGETLRDRLDREHQLPVDEAVRIATNVAEALDYAHRHGVIHRDIKPANILLVDGKPVVADFGIALAVTSGSAGRMTETGLSLGTPYYMSPEQATGDAHVGPATDIWALGCVLYEMLAGEPPYAASTPQAVLGKIITAEPPSVAEVRKSVPPNVDAAIRKALEKVPADRFRSGADLAKALSERAFEHGGRRYAHEGRDSTIRWRRVAQVASLSTLALIVVLGVLISQPVQPQPVERFPMPFEIGQEPVVGLGGGSFDLSPDGSTLVYPNVPEGSSLSVLLVRRWSETAAEPIADTEGATQVSFSPDGRSIAYSQANVVKTVPLAGGPALTLGDGLPTHWGEDGFIYSSRLGDVVRFPEAGGAPEVISAREAGENGRRVRDLLPRGRALLVVSRGGTQFEIHVLEVESGETEFLVAGEQPRYVPTGHLLYIYDRSLMAAPFDVRRARLTGPPVPLVDDISSYSVSDNGKLFYTGSSATQAMVQPAWVTRTGDISLVDSTFVFDRVDNNEAWSLSPDETRLAVRARTEDGIDIFVKHLGGGALSRLTFDAMDNRDPLWLADSRTVVFMSRESPGYAVYSRPIDGSSPPRRIVGATVMGVGTVTFTASSSGERMLFQVGNSIGGPDVVAVLPGQDSLARPAAAAPEYGERDPHVSQDGRWFAYVSNETGRDEVYARAFPGEYGSRQWAISTQGGTGPKWSRDGRELFFLGPDRAMYAVNVGGGQELDPSPPRRLFILPEEIDVAGVDFTYDVSRDGRFLMMRAAPIDPLAPVPIPPTLVTGFLDELRSLMSPP
jgi:serine/threonine-protein kinase